MYSIYLAVPAIHYAGGIGGIYEIKIKLVIFLYKRISYEIKESLKSSGMISCLPGFGDSLVSTKVPTSSLFKSLFSEA